MWPRSFRQKSITVAVLVALLASTLILARSADPAGASPAAPQATLGNFGPSFIGQSTTFDLTFDNTDATDAGYGPYVDLFLPATGVDGAGVQTDDGITFTSATYLGQAVSAQAITITSCVGAQLHPLTQLPIVCPTGFVVGDQLVVLTLPFGSFTATQPPVTMKVTAAVSNLADGNVPLPVAAKAGFRFGNDPLNNPATDPPLVQAVPTTATITPTLITLRKTYSGPESETATGPNFPRQYTVSVDIAAGQTVTSLALTDLLPNDMVFLGVDSMSPAGSVTAQPPDTTSPHNAPDNKLEVTFPTVVGTTGATDAQFTFSYFVPRLDANGAAVIDPASGDDHTSPNQAKAIGNWVPIDPRDVGSIGNAAVDAPGPEYTVTDKSIAIQKHVTTVTDVGATGPSPGDVLEWTLDFQASDYFNFRNLLLRDVFDDGMTLNPNSAELTYHDRDDSTSNFDLTPYVTTGVDNAPCGDGSTGMDVDLSAAMVAAGGNGDLTGGLVPGAPAAGATSGTITFRTTIDSSYKCLDTAHPVDSNDLLDNVVTISGDLLDRVTGVPTGQSESDGSSAYVRVVAPSLTKTVYARNGNHFDTGPKFSAGDTITYDLQIYAPLTNVQQLALVDFLPLPALQVGTLSTSLYTGPDAIPPAGFAKIGPADTYTAATGLSPTITKDPVGNSISFHYGDYQATTGFSPALIDVLVTVPISNLPFADGLLLTNQARLQYDNSFAEASTADAIIPFTLTEPSLSIKKGAVAATNPSAIFAPATVGPAGAPWTSGGLTSTNITATPIDSNVSGVDAGDLVTFATTVENTGSGLNGAFDVAVSDVVPAGFTVPSPGVLDLQVHNGAGTALAYTNVGGGAGLFDQGILLTDDTGASPPQGSLAAYSATSGTNVAVITYKLQVASTVAAGSVNTNTAKLDGYAASEGGPTFLDAPLTDVATATVANPGVTKTRTAPVGSAAVVGQKLTYQVAVRVPEGQTPTFTLRDTLDAGLTFSAFRFVSASAGLSTSVAGGFPTAATTPAVTPANGGGTTAGSVANFNFGTITNSDTDNATAETIVLEYDVVVLNVIGNQIGGLRNNLAQVYVGGSARGASSSATNITINEPNLTVSKTADVSQADANDTVTYTIVVSNPTATNVSAGYDVALRDALPAGVTYVPGSFTHTAGLAPDAAVDDSLPLDANWATFPAGSSSTFTFKATVDNGAALLGSTVTNTAVVTGSSLPGDVTTTQSPYNNFAVERTGNTADPGGAVNDYRATSSAGVLVAGGATTKSLVSTSAPSTTGSNVTIGETVTYRILVTLPEGDLGTVTVRDNLPNGLQYVQNSTTVTTTGAPLANAFNGTLPAPTVNLDSVTPTDGADPVLTFTGVSVVGDNDGTNNSFYVDLQARVLDVAGNKGDDTSTGPNEATSLSNTGSVTVASTTTTSAPSVVTVVEPRISITKAFSPTTAAANDTVTVNLAVTNHGTSTAFDVIADDLLDHTKFPGGDIAAGATPAGFTYSTTPVGADTRVVYTGGDLAPGATVNMSFTLKLASNVPVPGTTTNTAIAHHASTLPGSPADARTEPDASGSAVLTFTAPDLRVVKTDGISNVAPGQTHTYTITVYNDGARDANGVQLSDNLPSLDAYVSASNSGSETAPGSGVVTWPTFDLPAGTSVTRTVTVTLATPVPNGTTTITNHASATDDGTHGADPTPANNTGTDTDTVISAPDLTVSKSDGVTNAAPGDTLTYTLTVTNLGNQSAINALLADTIPANTTFISASAGGAETAPGSGVVQWPTFSLVGTGGATTRTVTVQVNPTVPAGVNTITNSATITAPGDSNAANNTGTDVDILDAAPDLVVTKTDGLTKLVPGQTATYTITVTNTGNQGATGVHLTDTFPSAPATLTFLTASNGGTFAGSQVSWANVAIPAGATITRTVQFMVIANPPAGTDTVVNTANAVDDGTNGPDPTPADNTGTDTDELVLTNLATITKSLVGTDQAGTSGANLAIGEVATFRLVVTLPEGPIDSFTVTDLLPDGFAYVPGSAVVHTSGAGLTAPFNGTVPAPTITPAVPTSGADVVAAFGPTNVVRDGDAADNSIAIDLDARVLDVPGNRGDDPATVPDEATHLSNGASLTIANSSTTATPVVTTVVEPRLTITKSFTPTQAAANDTTTVQLTVTNNGTADAYDVKLQDVLDGTFFPSSGVSETTTPAGFTYGSTTAFGDTTVAYSGGDIAVGASKTFTFTVTLADPLPLGGSVVNTATVTDATTLPGTSPDERNEPDVSGQATLNFTVPDIRVVKSDGTQVRQPGDTYTYTITVHNDGGRDATGVDLVDTLPASLEFVAAPGGTFHSGTNTVTWASFDLAAGGQQAFTVDVQVKDPLPNGVTSILNSATAADDGTHGPDPTPANNTDADLDTTTSVIDVALTKTDGLTSVVPGQTVTYTLTAENLGNEDAADVAITDTLPAHTTFVSASDGGTETAPGSGVVTWTAFPLAGAGAATHLATRTVTVRLDATFPAGVGTVANAATVVTTGDANATNNDATDVDTLDAAPELAVTKTDGTTTAVEGDTHVYTLTVTNNGNQDATGVAIVDQLPAGLTFQSASDGATESTPGSGTVEWPLVDLAAGATITRTVTVTVDTPVPDGTTSLTNTATVGDDGTNGVDPDLSNNTATDVDVTGADLAVTKDDGVTDVPPGGTTDYTITVTNHGPMVVHAMQLTEVLPVQLADATFTPSAGTFDSVTGEWSGLDLGVGDTVTLAVHATVKLNATGPLTNTVTVDPVGMADPNPTNNEAADTDTLTPRVDLALEKTLVGTLTRGENGTWHLVVKNLGPSTAHGVTVTDDLPAGLSYESANGDGWTCTAAGPVVTCGYVPPLDPGTTTSFNLVTAVASNAPDSITNQAKVSAVEAESVTRNDTSAAAGPVSSPPAAATGELPFTGRDPMTSLFIGLGLLGLGAVVLAVRTRRRHRRAD